MQASIRPWVTVPVGWFRRRRDLVLENAALRQQLAICERRRPRIHDADRWFLARLSGLWPRWRDRLSHTAGHGRGEGPRLLRETAL